MIISRNGEVRCSSQTPGSKTYWGSFYRDMILIPKKYRRLVQETKDQGIYRLVCSKRRFPVYTVRWNQWRSVPEEGYPYSWVCCITRYASQRCREEESDVLFYSYSGELEGEDDGDCPPSLFSVQRCRKSFYANYQAIIDRLVEDEKLVVLTFGEDVPFQYPYYPEWYVGEKA